MHPWLKLSPGLNIWSVWFWFPFLEGACRICSRTLWILSVKIMLVCFVELDIYGYRSWHFRMMESETVLFLEDARWLDFFRVKISGRSFFILLFICVTDTSLHMPEWMCKINFTELKKSVWWLRIVDKSGFFKFQPKQKKLTTLSIPSRSPM